MKSPTFKYGTYQALSTVIDFCYNLRSHAKLQKVDFQALFDLCEFVWENEDEEPDHTVREEPGVYCDEWDILRDLGFTQRDFI